MKATEILYQIKKQLFQSFFIWALQSKPTYLVDFLLCTWMLNLYIQDYLDNSLSWLLFVLLYWLFPYCKNVLQAEKRDSIDQIEFLIQQF